MSNTATMMGLGSGAGGATEFVGSVSGSNINGEVVTVDLSSVEIQAGDLILAGFFVGSGQNVLSTMNLTSTGYTELTSLRQSDTSNINMKTYGKFSDGAETNFVTTGGRNDTDAASVIVSIFRSVSELPTDEATGLAATGTDFNTEDLVWPEITDISGGNLLVYFGATAHRAGRTDYADPTDLQDFTTEGENDSYDVTGGFGYKVVDAETSFTANTWTVSGSADQSSVAYTVFKL
jgi:hypothetical protein